jgi:hypothetical protein
MTRERSTLDFIRTIVRRHPGRTLLLVLLLVLSGVAAAAWMNLLRDGEPVAGSPSVA